MKEQRQAQAQAKVENLARSSGPAKRVEAQARNESLAQSSGQSQANVDKWQIWKGSDVTKFAIKKLHWSLLLISPYIWKRWCMGKEKYFPVHWFLFSIHIDIDWTTCFKYVNVDDVNGDNADDDVTVMLAAAVSESYISPLLSIQLLSHPRNHHGWGDVIFRLHLPQIFWDLHFILPFQIICEISEYLWGPRVFLGFLSVFQVPPGYFWDIRVYFFLLVFSFCILCICICLALWRSSETSRCVAWLLPN